MKSEIQRQRVIFCWSGGKDSALALYRLRQDPRYEVVSLLTTCNETRQRVSMHGVRLELLERQAAAIGLPLLKVFLREGAPNEEYESRMAECLAQAKAGGVSACAFGDIFLQDLRAWREANLAKIGLQALFPLWRCNTAHLLEDFFRLGFQTVVCCASDAWFDDTLVGRTLNPALVAGFPPAVDPCGENGEYHSFTYAGPLFRRPIAFELGKKVYRPLEIPRLTDCPVSAPDGPPPPRGFWYIDLLA